MERDGERLVPLLPRGYHCHLAGTSYVVGPRVLHSKSFVAGVVVVVVEERICNVTIWLCALICLLGSPEVNARTQLRSNRVFYIAQKSQQQTGVSDQINIDGLSNQTHLPTAIGLKLKINFRWSSSTINLPL